MYKVLLPIRHETAERLDNGGFFYAVTWFVVGFANSMEDAKMVYGGSPVLEAV